MNALPQDRVLSSEQFVGSQVITGGGIEEGQLNYATQKTTKKNASPNIQVVKQGHPQSSVNNSYETTNFITSDPRLTQPQQQSGSNVQLSAPLFSNAAPYRPSYSQEREP